MKERLRHQLVLSFVPLAVVLGVSPVVGFAAEASGSTSLILPRPEIRSARPAGAPNIVVIVLDDVGFGAAGTFGGPIPTPELDALAKRGLRYNQFHTTAICSATRASLLTGRNHHAVGMGILVDTFFTAPYPGYDGMIPKSAATIAEILRRNGYSTSAWGKWHLIPGWETSPVGPFDHWPTGMGFEKYYGFIGGETDQFEPILYDGTNLVGRPRPPNYHLTEDLVYQAIVWMRRQQSIAPGRPFFMYFATGATHAPLQVPKPWIERFKGQFDQGWDKLREETFARQKRLRVIPANAQLTPQPMEIPVWDSLTADQKTVATRLMETYAGFLAHTDAQVGRLVAALEEAKVFDNTLFFYIVADNGASGEGDTLGTFNDKGALFGVREDTAATLRHLDQIGGRLSQPHYPVGWAWAMDTPFRWTKQVACYFGGTCNPLVVTWPKRIRDRGGLRTQFSHVNDIMPTILEAIGIPVPAIVNGVQQQRIDGVSLLYSFDDTTAKARHRTRYFEIFENRAIYHDGWIASAFHGRMPWMLMFPSARSYTEDTWELYHVDDDFSQARNVAQEHPEKLRELEDLFWAEFGSNNGLPLHERGSPEAFPSLRPPERKSYTYGPRMVIPEFMAPPLVSRSYVITTTIDVPETGAEGVLVAEGGAGAGWSLYVSHEGQPVYTYNYFQIEHPTVVGNAKLPSGQVTVSIKFAYDGGELGEKPRFSSTGNSRARDGYRTWAYLRSWGRSMLVKDTVRRSATTTKFLSASPAPWTKCRWTCCDSKERISQPYLRYRKAVAEWIVGKCVIGGDSIGNATTRPQRPAGI